MSRLLSIKERLLLHVPPVVYTHPFEIAVATASLLVGLTLLLSGSGAEASGLVLAPHWAVKVWQAMMLLGGPMTLVGLFWRHTPSTGMGVERAGLTILATAWGTRAIILVLTDLSHENMLRGVIIAAPLYLVVALSCQVRATVIRRSLIVATKAARRAR